MNVIYKILLTILFLFCFDFIVYCQNLNISFVDNKNKSNISLEFNNILKLNGLKLQKTNINEQLIIPYYKGKNNQYQYFTFLDRNFKNYVIDTVKTNNIHKSTDTIVTYKINKFNIVSGLPTIKAFVSVIFNDLLETQCSIKNGKYGLWVQWPSQKQDKKWEKMFIIKDKKLKDKIDNEILKVYKLKVSEKQTNDKFK